MLSIIKDADLKPYNTFGLQAKAKELAICPDMESLQQIIQDLKQNPRPYLVLGGGSNILFSKDFDGLLIHPTMNKINVINDDTESVWIEVDAGVDWDEFVGYCVNNNWYGLENLSYIPGNVGSSPVQNIGAYGVEVQDCIESVKGMFINSGETFEMTKEECLFDYRYSIFKGELKNKIVIASVVFKLSKHGELNLSYGPVKEEVLKKGKANLNSLRETIIEIRKSKLPEPDEMGNAGSFFKNPIIPRHQYDKLVTKNPSAPNYPIDKNTVKVPAGWLIDQAGWKGKSFGGASVHEKQALVLVNNNKATADDVIGLAQSIIADIKNKFDITLEPEVNII